MWAGVPSRLQLYNMYINFFSKSGTARSNFSFSAAAAAAAAAAATAVPPFLCLLRPEPLLVCP